MIDKIGLAILTMFGIGYFKYAPGTLASLITCVASYFLGKFFWEQSADDKFSHFILNYLPFIIFFLFIYSIILIDKLSHYFKKKDPKEIVIDEFLGQSIPCILICFKLKSYNMFGYQASPPVMEAIIPFSIAFVTFRIFDIFKPYPINIIDKKIHNGFGIIFDDILAGIYSAITTYLVLYIIY